MANFRPRALRRNREAVQPSRHLPCREHDGSRNVPFGGDDARERTFGRAPGRERRLVGCGGRAGGKSAYFQLNICLGSKSVPALYL
jgi:hypothetical protein